jgi:hypothetical protein
MNNKSVLTAIQNAVCQIQDLTPLQQEKSVKICKAMFNQYISDDTDFRHLKQFGCNYFYSIVPSKRDYKLKHVLVENNILDSSPYYSIEKGIAKAFRFNPKFFGAANVTSTDSTFYFLTNSNESTISYYCPHHRNNDEYSKCSDCLRCYFERNMDKLVFEDDIDEYISRLSNIDSSSLIMNNAILNSHVDLNLDGKDYRYTCANAIEFAKSTGNDLIEFKDRYYVDTPENFVKNKSIQLRISYCQSVFNIKYKLFYCGRNDTNNRIDNNLTGLKKELFQKLFFDGERLAELDIANAQFAIAAHLNPAIDSHFITYAQNGTLYQHVSEQLKIAKPDAKKLMFRIAFDKVKTTAEFENIRKLFPEFMTWVDSYKRKHGYKMFSNLLQRKEAEIMIDGLLMHLIDHGYDVFTIHDALRVKQSQKDQIRTKVQNYFDSIGFNCYLR